MLPSTAAEMANKLGVPWRPDLMTAKTDEGASYQRMLGEAYLQEGLERTGNPRDAIRYYHGGPDRSKWGPKTNAHADKVIGLMGGEQPMMPNVPPVFQGGMSEEPIGVASQGSLADLLKLDPMSPNIPNIEHKPGFFGQGGKGWNIVGLLGDAIAQHYGGQPVFGQMMSQERENERQLQMWRERVAAEREERMAAARKPYRFQNNAGDVVEIVPDTGQQRILYADPIAKPDFQRIENPDGSIVLQPVPSANRPTRDHIAALLANPERAADFDAKFGQPGLAEAILRGRR